MVCGRAILGPCFTILGHLFVFLMLFSFFEISHFIPSEALHILYNQLKRYFFLCFCCCFPFFSFLILFNRRHSIFFTTRRRDDILQSSYFLSPTDQQLCPFKFPFVILSFSNALLASDLSQTSNDTISMEGASAVLKCEARSWFIFCCDDLWLAER